MRTVFFVMAFVFWCSVAKPERLEAVSEDLDKSGRIAMVGPPVEEESVKELLGRISESCSKKDFRGFLNCFTAKKASSIRKAAENSFICGSIDMDVLDFFVISHDQDSICFGVRYSWDDSRSGKVIYCSKVIAKKQDDSWRIDSEEIREFRIHSASPSVQAVADRKKADCPDGMCNVRPAAQGQGWRLPNPANGGEEAFLPKDILYMPGPSCANGNCGIR